MGLLKLLYFSMRAAVRQGYVAKAEARLELLRKDSTTNEKEIRNWEVKLETRKKQKDAWDHKIEELKSK